MSEIPTNLTQAEFEKYVEPYPSKARCGYVCSIPLYKVFNYLLYFPYTGCQWKILPIDKDMYNPEKPEQAKTTNILPVLDKNGCHI